MLDLLEIALAIVFGYAGLLLLLELVIWRLQPDMEGGVTLHVKSADGIVKRKLFGLRHDGHLYVSSNHWFRRWYHAVLANPELDVEVEDQLGPYVAVPVQGAEHDDVARAYDMGIPLRIACDFAPQRFLRLDPGTANSSTAS